MSDATAGEDGTGSTSTPLEPNRLMAAVNAGILSEHQADRLAEFWVSPVATTPSANQLSFADREEVRFVRGFHDIFISIGLLILMVGLVYGLQDILPAWGIAGAGAVSIWVLAEIFSKRMRLALPSFLLSVAFTPFFFAACFGLVVDPNLSAIDPGEWVQQHESMLVLPATLLSIVGAIVFYWRFRVPVGIAAIAGGAFYILAILIEAVFPGLISANHALFFLCIGVMTFLLAMWFDSKDPDRVTLNTDKAFWLHLMAAPLIVHSILALVSDRFGDDSTPYSLTVIGLFLVLAAVALIVDRRALLVSAMSYLGFAIGYLIIESNVPEEAAFAVTLIILGGFILLIGSAWHLLRRVLLRPFAGTALLGFVPDPK